MATIISHELKGVRMLRVLVCGGRGFCDLVKMVDAFKDIPDDTILIHGCAAGTDSLAEECAKVNGWEIERYPAEWRTYGKKAGPMRNQRMLDEGKPDLVIAFPGGRGTEDMVTRARKAGVPVRIVR